MWCCSLKATLSPSLCCADLRSLAQLTSLELDAECEWHLARETTHRPSSHLVRASSRSCVCRGVCWGGGGWHHRTRTGSRPAQWRASGGVLLLLLPCAACVGCGPHHAGRAWGQHRAAACCQSLGALHACHPRSRPNCACAACTRSSVPAHATPPRVCHAPARFAQPCTPAEAALAEARAHHGGVITALTRATLCVTGVRRGACVACCSKGRPHHPYHHHQRSSAQSDTHHSPQHPAIFALSTRWPATTSSLMLASAALPLEQVRWRGRVCSAAVRHPPSRVLVPDHAR
jgi:hypothetical protein